MNVPEYIASGILESYVLGAVSDQERQEVECLSAIYPDIRQELDRLTTALEGYVLTESTDPPARLKDQIMAQLSFEEPAETPAELPAVPVSRPTYPFTWVAAASVGLLMILVAYFLYAQLRQTQQTAAQLRTSNQSLTEEVRQLRDRQARDAERLAILQQPGMRVIRLRGTNKAPSGDLYVYWNTQKRIVNVEVRSLPTLPADQQYQLWSLVDGKPVDAGVFDAGTPDSVQTLNRAIGRADAFAVTIERRGGSPTPTLTNLVASGQSS